VLVAVTSITDLLRPMPSFFSLSAAQLHEHLKSRVSPTCYEVGWALARSGSVLNLSQPTVDSMTASVRDPVGTTQATTITASRDDVISIECSCSRLAEFGDQWCEHAVATLVQRYPEMPDPLQSEEVIAEHFGRTWSTPPSEVANVLSAIGLHDDEQGPAVSHILPEVSVLLDVSSDRLGVKVLFNGEPQHPHLGVVHGPRSDRALDSILLHLLEERGSWDALNSMWFVNASADIKVILGLIEEYKDVVAIDTGEFVRFSKDPVSALLELAWSEHGVDISMEWLLPDGIRYPHGCDLIGTGPYWIALRSTLYPVTELAARIATLFPHGPTVSIPRYQAGAILESIPSNSPFLRIVAPDLQPTTEVHRPTPVLTFALKQTQIDHFSSGDQLELSATLEFDYPSPPGNKNVVYLPDRPYEVLCCQILEQHGFTWHPDRRRFTVSGDNALDALHDEQTIFPKDWRLVGLDSIRKGLRFSDLSVQLSLASPQATNPEEGGNWFDCQLSLVQNNANVPLSTLFKRATNEMARWIRLDSGAFAKIPGGGLFQLKSILGVLDPNFKLSNSIKTKLSVPQALGLSSVEHPQFLVKADSQLLNLRQKLLDFSSIPKGKIHRKFKGKLRIYQNEGVGWLQFLHECSLSGILADEMGLGKTVQTLAFLQNLHRGNKDEATLPPSLIIAPTSVITNWLYEARRFTPDLSCLLLQGPHRKRLFSRIPLHQLVITSYALLRLDRHELSQYQFSYLVLDEAQNIKNPQAATTKAAKALRTQNRLALSGTPTENRPLELWSIMDFLMPGYLGSHDFFRSYVEKPILEGGPGVKVAESLKSKVRPFILRRTKHQVERDLPPKIESVLHVEMTNSQKELYSQILEEVRPKVFDAVDKRGVAGASVSILTALLRLRQVCNHPNSIGALRMIDGFESGKFNLFKELVTEALESDRKILVFSQFREMLAIMRSWIDSLSIPYLYLDGMTKDRQDLVDSFNKDESIRLFLISLKAGGTGLNLTAADTVVIYDPWWNPAVESQAVDRAHRIGQVKTVNVYRLVTEHSVEQRIMELKSKKSDLIEALVNENGMSTLNLSKKELESLFDNPLGEEDGEDLFG
jgi:superfamily II DNA or RNA helicase